MEIKERRILRCKDILLKFNNVHPEEIIRFFFMLLHNCLHILILVKLNVLDYISESSGLEVVQALYLQNKPTTVSSGLVPDIMCFIQMQLKKAQFLPSFSKSITRNIISKAHKV